MARQTVLHDQHLQLGAKMVDFAGWDMPIHYGSQIEEHRAVRSKAGMFDVSHMAAVDIHGPQALALLQRLWANDMAKAATPGKAIYTCMLNPQGGVIDDLIAYYLQDGLYRTVVNAGTAEKDLTWMQQQAQTFDATVTRRKDLAIIAVQGPSARQLVAAVISARLAEKAMALKPFFAAVDGDWLVGRTGYTGEDGFELIVPADEAIALWHALQDAGAVACGLGARDTLRLEAGLNLYGQDMDEKHNPLEAGLGWTVAWQPQGRAFIGRQALEQLRASRRHKMVGLLLESRGVLRAGQQLRQVDGGPAGGVVTSGSYAPTLERSIGLARVPHDWQDGVEVDMRGKWRAARIVKYPFVRMGEVKVDLV